MTDAFRRLLDRRVAGSSRGPVRSAEFRRVEALPERPPRSDFNMSRWRRSDSQKPRGIFSKLFPAQIEALHEIFLGKSGLVGACGVGSGKTGISILAGSVARAERVLLVVPTSLKQRTLDDIEEFAKDWLLSCISVLSWTDLQHKKNRTLLDDLGPFDMIVFDEAHNLKNRKSARGGRVYQHLKENPRTRVVALSGTMTRKSVADVAWIFEAALGEGSPLPRTWSDIEDWAAATDVKPLVKYQPGALMNLMRDGETPREAVWRKIKSVPGVFSGNVAEEDLPSLTIKPVDARAPSDILSALATLEREWELPGGLMLADPTAVWRAARQLSLGFCYKPSWDEATSTDIRKEWTEARHEWSKFVRQNIRVAHDSEALVKSACRAGILNDEVLLRWEKVLALTRGPTKIECFLPGFSKTENVVARWFKTADSPGLVWVSSVAVGERLARSFLLPYLGAGSTEATVNAAERAFVSIGVCGVGMNLQRFADHLVLEPPVSGLAWEQLLGRSHRPGQKSDEVDVETLVWTPPLRAAWNSALAEADYLRSAQGPQKLLLATKVGF